MPNADLRFGKIPGSEQLQRDNSLHCSDRRKRTQKDDHEVILDAGLNVISLIDDWQPANVLEKVNGKPCAFGTRCPGERPCSNEIKPNIWQILNRPRKNRFAKLVNGHQPDIVIVECVTLAYLLPERRKRQGMLYAARHARLTFRSLSTIQAISVSHWLEIDRAPRSRSVCASFNILINSKRRSCGDSGDGRI